MILVGGKHLSKESGANTGDIKGFLDGSPFLTKEEIQNFKKAWLRMGSSIAIRVDGKKVFRSSIRAG